MHILLFYQYYHNRDCAATGRHFSLIKSLSQQHRVTVITSDVWEHKRQTHLYPWAPDGVDIISMPVPYDNAMHTGGRLKAYAGYAWQAFRQGLRVQKPDIIIGSSTPLTAAWAAAKVAQLRRIPWVFEVRDLWPDFPIQMGAIRNTWIQRRLYNMEHRLYRSASHIITLSPDMETHVVNKGLDRSKITTLLNGTDLDLAHQPDVATETQLREQYSLQQKKVVLYAGTFGRANAIPLLIDSAKKLTHRQDIHFVFMGAGYHEAALRETAASVPNITMVPAEPRHRIFNWFRIADLALVSFLDIPVLAANSPAKFFDSLACGTPVVVTNPGWTKTFIEKHHCGWYANANEPESLVRCIEEAIGNPDELKQAGINGQQQASILFDRSIMAESLNNILLQCTSSSGTNA